MTIVYLALVISLFCSPLLMPNNGKEYTALACCIFVALCYMFKIRSFLRTIIPVLLFAVVMPATVLIAIARPISPSWKEAAILFYGHFTVDILFSLIMPVVFTLILYFILHRVAVLKRN